MLRREFSGPLGRWAGRRTPSAYIITTIATITMITITIVIITTITITITTTLLIEKFDVYCPADIFTIIRS